VALARPRSEEQENLGAFVASYGVPLVGLEVGQGPGPGLDFLTAGRDARRAFDDEHPGVLLDLVVAELLARIEADEDGAGLVLALQHDGRTASVGRVEFGEIPGFHGCGSVSAPR
jgi:hypothetical protein